MAEKFEQGNGLIRVGVLSDTHGTLPSNAYAALADCDHIIHAGDIGNPNVLRTLKTLAPVTAVLGNNDFDEYGADVTHYAHPVIGGVRFLVAHYPQDVYIGTQGSKALAPGDPLPKVCIHGHTHIPRLVTGKEASPADYILCPGAAFRPRGGSKRSIAKLLVGEGIVHDIQIEELT